MNYTCENCENRNAWYCRGCGGIACASFKFDESTLRENGN